MPKMNPLTIKGRKKACRVAIHALQLELDDPIHFHETQVEIRYLRDRLKKELDRFDPK